MPPEQSSDVKFEIGHVLFIDIVGYSKLLNRLRAIEVNRPYQRTTAQPWRRWVPSLAAKE